MPKTDAGISVKEEAEGKATALAALADLRHESDGLKAQVGRLSADLASARDSLEAGDKKQAETQARADSLAKELEEVRAHASNLKSELPAVEAKSRIQSAPAGWLVVVGSAWDRNSANDKVSQFNDRCKPGSLVIKSEEIEGGNAGFWRIVLGPYLTSTEAEQILKQVQQCPGEDLDFVARGKVI